MRKGPNHAPKSSKTVKTHEYHGAVLVSLPHQLETPLLARRRYLGSLKEAREIERFCKEFGGRWIDRHVGGWEGNREGGGI